MKKVTKEVKIGIAFIIALALLYFGINFLKGINILKPANSFVVVFDDVAGMLTADPITINGLKVGQVSGMSLNPNNPKNILVYVQMDKGVQIRKGSKISLDAGVLGGSKLILDQNLSENEYHIAGDTLIGDKKAGLMDVAASFVPKIESLLPKLDSILVGMDRLVNETNLDGTLRNVNTITSDFAKSSKEINILLASLNKDVPTLTKSLGNTASNFEVLSTQFRGIDVTSTFNKLDSTMTNVQFMSSKLTSKDNSLGLLLNDRAMYDSLNTTFGNASLLLKDVKENPSRYINIKVF